MKTHWKKLENPDYLGAYSLEASEVSGKTVYKDINVTIDKVVREMVTGSGGKKEECTVAYFKNIKKPMILNRTNQKMIQKIYETPFIEDWAGKTITLYVAFIKAFGEDNVECLRVRNKKPELPELTPNSPVWDKVMSALSSGNFTIAQVKTKYRISNKNEKLLTS